MCLTKSLVFDSRSVVPGGQLITVSAIGAPPAMLFTTMAGIHQSVNLACALQAVRLVMEHDDAISEETMREGFAVPLGLVVLRLKKRWIGHLYLMVPTMQPAQNLSV